MLTVILSEGRRIALRLCRLLVGALLWPAALALARIVLVGHLPFAFALLWSIGAGGCLSRLGLKLVGPEKGVHSHLFQGFPEGFALVHEDCDVLPCFAFRLSLIHI